MIVRDEVVFRYRNDQHFKTLVDSMVLSIREGQFTARDLIDAEALAEELVRKLAVGTPRRIVT